MGARRSEAMDELGHGPRCRRGLGFATVVALVAACDRPVTEPHHEAPLMSAPPDRAAPALAAGFQEQRFVALGFDPTAMEFSPEGRLFVADQAGRLRVVKNGSLLPTPFL